MILGVRFMVSNADLVIIKIFCNNSCSCSYKTLSIPDIHLVATSERHFLLVSIPCVVDV
jgi:hypothetical protein